MKIIVLQGCKDTGKTTTLNDVCSLLDNTFTPKIKVGRKKDFERIINYKNKKIAIYSMGDYLNYCVEYIAKSIAAGNIDVLIFAARPFISLKRALKYMKVVSKKSATNNDNSSARDKIIAAI